MHYPAIAINKFVRVERDNVQIEHYKSSCNELVMTDQLKDINFPQPLTGCSFGICGDLDHRLVITDLYAIVVRVLRGAAMEI